MKKKLILFLLLAVVITVLPATGSKEKNEIPYAVSILPNGQPVMTDRTTGEPITKGYDPAHSMLYGLLRSIGNTLDELATVLVINLHPFPSIMSKFYDYNGDYGVTSKDEVIFDPSTDILSSSGYYKQKYPDEVNDAFKGLVKSDKDQQLSRFAVITSLFVVLISCEIIFSAIWSYVSGKETFLFKDIVTKVALCFLLFLLCAALPFLLEAVRWGLFRMAFFMFPPTSDSITYEFTIFEMCGAFIDQLVFLLDRCDPSYIGLTDVNDLTDGSSKGVSIGGFGRILISLLYFIFKILIFFEFIKAALHIFMNIVEVYILLTVAMILMPFAVFFPTKSFGDKVVMSLFNNLVECFILLLIIIIVVPACVKSSGFLFIYLPEGQEVKYHTMTANIPISNDGYSTPVPNPQIPTTINISSDCVIMWSRFTSSVDMGDGRQEHVPVVYLLYGTLNNVKYTSTGLGEAVINEILGVNKDTIIIEGSLFETPSMKLNPTKNVRVSNNNTEEVGIAAVENYGYEDSDAKWYQWATNLIKANDKALIYFASTAAKMKYPNNPERVKSETERLEESPRSIFKEILPNDTIRYNSNESYYNQLYKEIDSSDTLVKTNPIEASKKKVTQISDNAIIKHMVIIFICVYLPCYFVMQSSQITQALMQGGVAQESFSNALSQSSHNTIMAPLKVASTVIGAASRTGLDMAMHRGKGGGGSGPNDDPPQSIQSGI